MKDLLLILLLVITIDFVVVLIVQTKKNISTQEAQSIVLNFVKCCFSSSPHQIIPEIQYPVFIGIDDNGLSHADVIESEFKPLEDIFNPFYYYGSGRQQNRIWYAFKTSNPLKQMTDYDLIQYCEKICDSLVHRYMHKMNPSITHVNNLVSAHYQENILTFYIAINNKGTMENSNQSLQTRSLYNQTTTTHNSSITESWSDR